MQWEIMCLVFFVIFNIPVIGELVAKSESMPEHKTLGFRIYAGIFFQLLTLAEAIAACFVVWGIIWLFGATP